MEHTISVVKAWGRGLMAADWGLCYPESLDGEGAFFEAKTGLILILISSEVHSIILLITIFEE